MAKSLIKGVITGAARVRNGRHRAWPRLAWEPSRPAWTSTAAPNVASTSSRPPGLQPLTVQQALSVAPAASIYGSKAIGGAIVMIDQSEFSNWEAHGGQGRGKTVFTLHQLTALAYRPGGVEGIEGFFLNEKWYPISASCKALHLPAHRPHGVRPDGRARRGSTPTRWTTERRVKADTKGSNEHPAFYPVAFEMGLGDGETSGLYSARPLELSDKSQELPRHRARHGHLLGCTPCSASLTAFCREMRRSAAARSCSSPALRRITTVVKGNKLYDPRRVFGQT